VLPKSEEQARRLFRFTRIDVVIAMTLAGLIKYRDCSSSPRARFQERPHGRLFARDRAQDACPGCSAATRARSLPWHLLGSGLSSSTVGTLAGQVVMQGFIRRPDPRLGAPAGDDAAGADRDRHWSRPFANTRTQPVVLSFGIPFALIPLVIFTANRKIMGPLVNHRATTIIATLVAALISA